jgi:hypothetical protein
MGGLGDSAAKYVTDVIGRTTQQPGKRPVSRLFAPLAEQMKYEKKRILRGGVAGRRQVLFDRVQEDRHRGRAVCLGGVDGFDGQSFLKGQSIENLSSVHAVLPNRLPREPLGQERRMQAHPRRRRKIKKALDLN